MNPWKPTGRSGERIVNGFARVLLLVVLALPVRALCSEAVPNTAPAGTSPEETPTSLPEKVTAEPTVAPHVDPSVAGKEPLDETASDPEVLLHAALEAMDQAVIDLHAETTPQAVQDQQAAVDQLKKLLATATSSRSNKPKSPSNLNSPSSSEAQDEKPSEANSSEPTGGGGRRADDENSAESSENIAGPTEPGSGVLAPGTRANSVWGHLPPRQREALFRSLSDNLLPEYEAQIRSYYEAIAEKK